VFFIPVVLLFMPINTPEKYAERFKNKKPFSEHRWEDGKTYPIPQDFADMLGWQELAQKVDAVYATLPNKQHVFILCDNYGQAGAINYYTKNKLVANSFNADYPQWMDLSQPIYTIIRVIEYNASLNREMQLFAKVNLRAHVTNRYARERGTKIVVLAEPRANVNEILARERAKRVDGP
jgi:hypothetical protein